MRRLSNVVATLNSLVTYAVEGPDDRQNQNQVRDQSAVTVEPTYET